MKAYLACPSCLGRPLRFSCETIPKDILDGTVPTSCLYCGKTAKIVFLPSTTLVASGVLDISPEEFLQVHYGLGLKSERKCDRASVQELFKSQPIRSVQLSDVEGTTRPVLDSIELWDGTRLYLGASPHGAVVYRVTKDESHVTKELGGDGG